MATIQEKVDALFDKKDWGDGCHLCGSSFERRIQVGLPKQRASTFTCGTIRYNGSGTVHYEGLRCAQRQRDRFQESYLTIVREMNDQRLQLPFIWTGALMIGAMAMALLHGSYFQAAFVGLFGLTCNLIVWRARA